jgi:hypothetical protein
MKKLWSEFEISNQLDEGSVASPDPRGILHGRGSAPDLSGQDGFQSERESPDLAVGAGRARPFAERVQALDQALTGSTPGGTPPHLHGAIMLAVRREGHRAASGRAWALGWRWLAPAAAGVVLVAGIWFGGSERPKASVAELVLVRNTLDASVQIARAVPASALSPLQDELNRVNRDVDNTARALFATLPGL